MKFPGYDFKRQVPLVSGKSSVSSTKQKKNDFRKSYFKKIYVDGQIKMVSLMYVINGISFYICGWLHIYKCSRIDWK